MHKKYTELVIKAKLVQENPDVYEIEIHSRYKLPNYPAVEDCSGWATTDYAGTVSAAATLDGLVALFRGQLPAGAALIMECPNNYDSCYRARH